jgi:general secretion pathway protein E
LVSERDLAEAFSALLDIPLVTANDFPAKPVLEDRINKKFLKHARFIPLDDEPTGVGIAMADPLDDFTARAVEFVVKKPILRRVALPSDIDAAYERLYGDGQSALGQIVEHVGETTGDTTDDIERLKDLASEAPVIRLVNMLITQAVEEVPALLLE